MYALLMIPVIMNSVLAQNPGCELIICENERKTIDCPVGQVVDIQEAFYGREDRITCADTDHPVRNTACSSPVALDRYRDICNNKTRCTLEASRSVTGDDTCPGSFKYARIGYTCVSAKPDFLTRTKSTNSSLVQPQMCIMTSTPAKTAVTSDAVRITTQSRLSALLTTGVPKMTTNVESTPDKQTPVDDSCGECCFKLKKSGQISHEELKSILRDLKHHCKHNKIDC